MLQVKKGIKTFAKKASTSGRSFTKALDKTAQDGKWVTIRGRKIFLPKGNEKQAINNAFSAFKAATA